MRSGCRLAGRADRPHLPLHHDKATQGKLFPATGDERPDCAIRFGSVCAYPVPRRRLHHES